MKKSINHFIFLIFISCVTSCGDSLFVDDITKPVQDIISLEPAKDLSDLFDESYTKVSYKGLDFYFRFDRDPIVGDDMKLEINVVKENEFFSPTDFFIDIWMPDHGHGSWPIKIEEVEEGKYIASDIFFIMPGLWDVRFFYLGESSKEVFIWSYDL
mgnify:CR=1 FL=1